MEWADKNNVGYVMVIGCDEVVSGEIEIKDMKNYNKDRVKIDDINKIVNIIND
jgi:histidyl-tRNA synthetase